MWVGVEAMVKHIYIVHFPFCLPFSFGMAVQLRNGRVFEDTRVRGRPFEFLVGEGHVIAGACGCWDLHLQIIFMNVSPLHLPWHN